MAAPVKPKKTTANGKDSWWLVPTVADTSAPAKTEIDAAGGLNISCFLLAEQEGVTGTTEKVALARLLCETTTTEGIGETTFSMADVQGVFNPQAADGADEKKFWDLVKSGFVGYAVRRQGVKADTESTVTVGDFVDVMPIEMGPAIPGKSATDASGIYTFTAAVAVTGTPEFNVAVVAGP